MNKSEPHSRICDYQLVRLDESLLSTRQWYRRMRRWKKGCRSWKGVLRPSVPIEITRLVHFLSNVNAWTPLWCREINSWGNSALRYMNSKKVLGCQVLNRTRCSRSYLITRVSSSCQLKSRRSIRFTFRNYWSRSKIWTRKIEVLRRQWDCQQARCPNCKISIN